MARHYVLGIMWLFWLFDLCQNFCPKTSFRFSRVVISNQPLQCLNLAIRTALTWLLSLVLRCTWLLNCFAKLQNCVNRVLLELQSAHLQWPRPSSRVLRFDFLQRSLQQALSQLVNVSNSIQLTKMTHFLNFAQPQIWGRRLVIIAFLSKRGEVFSVLT